MRLSKPLLMLGLAMTLATAGCFTQTGGVTTHPHLQWETIPGKSNQRNVTNQNTGSVATYHADGGGRYRCIRNCQGFPRYLTEEAIGVRPAPTVDRPDGDGGPDDGH